MAVPNILTPSTLGFGAYSRPIQRGIGRTFFVASSTFVSEFQALYPASEAVANVYTSITSALADCQTNHGDMILLDPSYTTAPTAADLTNARTKGVLLLPAAPKLGGGIYGAYRATNTLAQSAAGNIFTITGRVLLIDVIGIVTTVIQTQADNLKLQSVATVNGTTDICAVANISAAAVGTLLSITGTFATALQITTGGAFVYQAAPVVLEAGALAANYSASNTGRIQWDARYKPLDPGAMMIAA